jgi:N-methylhydantoinase A/oxoprolinase/acetone carboxylase beta subunit/N-methylhydantoinase B/oxoprolinase/acetone carboxylase alpha subunit
MGRASETTLAASPSRSATNRSTSRLAATLCHLRGGSGSRSVVEPSGASTALVNDVRIASDIGGTFTDVVAERGSQRWTAKVLTTPRAPEEGVMQGIFQVLQKSQLRPEEIGICLHGTTLATNAIIEKRGAVTALVTTKGFRDIVDIGYESRYDQYDLQIEKKRPLTPRSLRFTVAQRNSARGDELVPLDEEGVRRLVPQLRAAGVASIAVCYFHSYANPQHERRTRELLLEAMPEISVTLSSEVCPEIREFERSTTAICNAYVQPLMASYLGRLETQLAENGFDCPTLLMTSGGGLTDLATAAAFPIRLVESGPAGGAVLASVVAKTSGIGNAVSFDMGGTTAKICLLQDSVPSTAREFEVDRAGRFAKGSGLPLRIPVVEMVEIGAGGGSIASIDPLGRVATGPESAGSEPGPASYGRGGLQPTVTDANVVLGRIQPELFAGGKMPLDRSAAVGALDAEVSAAMGFSSAELAATAVANMVEENMANATRVHAGEKGRELLAHSLIVFGGSAPVHAVFLADKLSLDHIIIPTDAGVGSALGFLRAPISYEVVNSLYSRLSAFDAMAVATNLDTMRAEASTVVEAGLAYMPPASRPEMYESTRAFMRYLGQGHEILVDFDPSILAAGADAAGALRALFEEEYRIQFSNEIPGGEVEILSWGLTITADVAPPSFSTTVVTGTAGVPTPQGTKVLWDTAAGQAVEVPVFQRAELALGTHIDGPAIVVEENTSTVVNASFSLDVMPNGDLHLNRVAAAGVTAAAAAAADGSLQSNGGGGGTLAGAGDQLVQIQQQTMWARLNAVVEEQATALLRTAMSVIVREGGDLSCGIFDQQGRMMAQAVTGTPGHVNSMAESVMHFMGEFPDMQPGDVYTTNDPWLGTGHLWDFMIVTPAFFNGKFVGTIACTSHITDVGGLGYTPDGTDVHMEGLYVPMLKLVEGGVKNETLFAMLKQNTRQPVETIGDIYSLMNCNEVGRLRLMEMMEEYSLDSLQPLSDYICETSETAVTAQIKALPNGTWHNTIVCDGEGELLGEMGSLVLTCSLTIADGIVSVDYTGTCPTSKKAINVPLAYTRAYTAFGLACVLAKDVPNNAGSLKPFQIDAPEGCILNATYPCAVASRHSVGQLLPDCVFGCLAQIDQLKGEVPAEGAAVLWQINARGSWVPGPNAGPVLAAPTQQTQRPWVITSITNGGTGARPGLDGLDATAYPSGVRGTPIEINESIAPLIFHRKEFRTDSAGAGRTRGGLGLEIEVQSSIGADFDLMAVFERTEHPALGRHGGAAGKKAHVRLSNGEHIFVKGLQTIPAGETLLVSTPGGGGVGAPAERDPEQLLQDVRDGIVRRTTPRPSRPCPTLRMPVPCWLRAWCVAQEEHPIVRV